jgi:hypothetical protein
MKLQFLSPAQSPLAREDSDLLARFRAFLLSRPDCVEAFEPEAADAILINEAYYQKIWRYIRKLKDDPVVGRFPHKTYTLNTDDSGKGLLRGLYTSLPASCFDPRLHRAIPFPGFANARVLPRRNEPPGPRKFLAGWRGNPMSHRARGDLLRRYSGNPRFLVQGTESWYNHPVSEQDHYVDLLRSCKFSLCPTGIGCVTFRVYESMALGVAPVIVGDDFVLPEGPDWPACSLTVRTNQLSDLETILTRREDKYLGMGERARREWERFFSPEKVYGYYARALLELMEIPGRRSRTAERRRWSSFSTYWKHRWTLLHRLQHRLGSLRG